MNKGELIDKISDSTGIRKEDVDLVLSKATGIIVDAVAEGERVTLVGFGSFEKRYRKERNGRNPKTGQRLKIEPRHVPGFSAGKGFKERVS